MPNIWHMFVLGYLGVLELRYVSALNIGVIKNNPNTIVKIYLTSTSRLLVNTKLLN